ncbi:ComF family protein [Halomicrococcus gelatinilyticus]|uniref:ComF family protein n=1 Tax=Halomicrococcus gelatinilyticus TaxID=1702103 RepID=UPI002E140DE5
MTTYSRIEDAWEELEDFEGAPVIHPKYQCRMCGEPIEESFTRTSGVCFYCNKGKNEVGEFVDRIFTVSIYFKQTVTSDHELSKEIRAAKEGENVDKMSDILGWGMGRFTSLTETDILVPPPSGSGEEYNHMAEIGKRLSNKVGVELADVTYKLEDYSPQKDMDNQEDRKENVRGKVGCDKDLSDVSKAVVIDDIVTTCSTISDTARALKEAGVDTVYGLGIARTVSFEGLVHAEALEEVDNGN